MGEVIGAIVAETEDQARAAAKAVHVAYEELPLITSIEVTTDIYDAMRRPLSRAHIF